MDIDTVTKQFKKFFKPFFIFSLFVLITFLLASSSFGFDLYDPMRNLVHRADNNYTSDMYLKDGYFSANRGSLGARGSQGNKVDYSEKLKENLKRAVIVIDPGHGGNDYGTCFDKVFEKDINLDISLRFGELLKQSGVKVVFTRESDEYISLKKRADIANEAGAALFISVHSNGIDNDENCKGTETLYYNIKKSDDEGMNSKKLAEIVQKHMVEKLGTHDRGIIYRPKLAILRLAKMPTVIVEPGYLTNPSDREKLITPDYKQKAAQALYDAVIEALEEIE